MEMGVRKRDVSKVGPDFSLGECWFISQKWGNLREKEVWWRKITDLV